MTAPGANSMSALRQRLEAQDSTVKRCNSLFDLETDQLMQHNQLTGQFDPEWKRSQYRICGSFVDSKQGGKKPKAVSLSLSKKESFLENDKVVEFSEEMLKSNSNALNTLSNLSQLQSVNSLSSLLPGSSSSSSQSQNQLLQGMLKRQSMIDFEKSLQYFSPANMNMNVNFQPNLLNTSFLSPQNSLGNIFQQQNTMAASDFQPAKTPELPEEALPLSLSYSKRKLKEEGGSERSRKRGKWADHEDKILQDLANRFLNRQEKINFKKIAEHLPGRSAKQCREHWLSTLNPDLKKGRWTKAEELLLLDLMVAHGKSWSIIAKEISGRAEHSVKAKGRLMLGERLKTIPPDGLNYEGSEEQKQKLFELHQTHKDEYEEISKLSGFIVSPAKIERTMLAICKCDYCVRLMDDIKNTNSCNLLQGWTKVKARQMRELLQKKSNKYATADQLFGVMQIETPEGAETPSNSGQRTTSSANSAAEERVHRLGNFSKLSQFTPGAAEPEKEEGELLVSIM